MKYNKSEIMKKAWELYRKALGWLEHYRLTFAQALKRAWQMVKDNARYEEQSQKEGRETMHYSKYKNEYSHCATVEGSYNKRDKTIVVLTKVSKQSKYATNNAKHNNNGLCPKCGTYCYGDCSFS